LISAAFACVAFFVEKEDNSEASTQPFGNFVRNINWRRFALLAVVELAAGVLLYVLFTFMPFIVQATIVAASWVVLTIEWGNFPKNKSVGSLLSEGTGLAGLACFAAWRITHEEVWSRLMLVIACLMAGRVFLDRRREWLDIE
jgi:hypothetical protein